MKVAYLGLGSMGGPHARLLARAGHALTVYDPFAPAREAFTDIATIATSGAEAARSAEIACVCVRDDRQVEDAVMGEHGLAAGLGVGSLLLIHSTIKIETILSLHAKLAPRGITLMDAPVTRTRRTDDDRFVMTMLGGDAAHVGRAKQVVEAFSTDIIYAGPLGAGMALKIANNLVTWVQLMVGMQAQTLVSHFGVSYEQLRDVMKANGNLTPTMQALLDGRANYALGTDPKRDAFQASQAGVGEKDLTLAIESGLAAGLDTGMIAKARDLVRPLMTGS